MVFNKGITLIEIVIIICIIAIFAVILVADFPKIQRQFALSRIAYKFGQDIRRAEDLGLSGVAIKDDLGNSINAKGYGIFVNRDKQQQYGIYADRGGDYKYDGNQQFCSSITDINGLIYDCIVEIIDISKEDLSLYIKGFKNASGNPISINFRPPDPIVNIENICDQENCAYEYKNKIGIVFGLTTDDSAERTVYINTSGLIEVK